MDFIKGHHMNWVRCALAIALIFTAIGASADGPYPDTDAAISAAVERVLWKEGSLAHTDIRVESLEGQVTLRGFAATMEDIVTANRLARAVRGVRGVTNAIRVAVRPSRA